MGKVVLCTKLNVTYQKVDIGNFVLTDIIVMEAKRMEKSGINGIASERKLIRRKSVRMSIHFETVLCFPGKKKKKKGANSDRM